MTEKKDEDKTQKFDRIWDIIRNTWLKDTHNYKRCIKQNLKAAGKKYDPKVPVGVNIYDSKGTMKDYIKIQHRVHRWFKLRLVQPIILLGDLLLGKHKVKKIPKKKQFELLGVWDEAFEEALTTWCNVFRASHGSTMNKTRMKVMIAGLLNSRATKTLRSVKQWYNTGMHNDTSYLMFHNILMFEIWRQMHNKFVDSPELKHLLYSSNKIDDLKYFVMQGVFPDQIDIPVNDVLRINLNMRTIIQNLVDNTVSKQEMTVVQKPGDKVPTDKDIKRADKKVKKQLDELQAKRDYEQKLFQSQMTQQMVNMDAKEKDKKKT